VRKRDIVAVAMLMGFECENCPKAGHLPRTEPTRSIRGQNGVVLLTIPAQIRAASVISI
jgi:hypothetical protein